MPPTTQPLTHALQAEFYESFRMFGDVVSRLTDEQWFLGQPTWAEVPARAAMHTLHCAAFYIAPSGDGYDWEPAGVRYYDAPVDRLPTRAATLQNINRIAADTNAYLARHGDTGLLTGLAESAKQGQTRVRWMIYALRHLQHHVAQLSAESKRRGLGPASWE